MLLGDLVVDIGLAFWQLQNTLSMGKTKPTGAPSQVLERCCYVLRTGQEALVMCQLVPYSDPCEFPSLFYKRSYSCMFLRAFKGTHPGFECSKTDWGVWNRANGLVVALNPVPESLRLTRHLRALLQTDASSSCRASCVRIGVLSFPTARQGYLSWFCTIVLSLVLMRETVVHKLSSKHRCLQVTSTISIGEWILPPGYVNMSS